MLRPLIAALLLSTASLSPRANRQPPDRLCRVPATHRKHVRLSGLATRELDEFEYGCEAARDTAARCAIGRRLCGGAYSRSSQLAVHRFTPRAC